MISCMCTCQTTYKELKTGFTFNDIRQMLYKESKEKRERNNEHMFITRHTILGRWHEMKLRIWKEIQNQIDLYGCECENKKYESGKIEKNYAGTTPDII